MSYSRRKFLTQVSLTGAASFVLPKFVYATETATTETETADERFTILFQGDSITDGNRGRTEDPNHIMGHGYAFSIASRLGADYPERNLKFINKGISGNTIADLASRWQQDAIDLKANVLSILVGVNDVYFLLKDNTGTLEQFEKTYDTLLQDTVTKQPGVVLVLGEPFILPVGMVNENREAWTREIQHRQQVVKKLAAKYNAVWVGYQDVFDKACSRAPAGYWIWDGIHPTVAGHELMAREWMACVSKKVSIITSHYKGKK